MGLRDGILNLMGAKAASQERKVSMRERTLEAAFDCVMRDRNVEYGPPEDSFASVAAHWTTHLQVRYPQSNIKLDSTDVALMMSLLKSARLSANPSHFDSWVDLAGYAACGAESAIVIANNLPKEVYPKETQTDNLVPQGIEVTELPIPDNYANMGIEPQNTGTAGRNDLPAMPKVKDEPQPKEYELPPLVK